MTNSKILSHSIAEKIKKKIILGELVIGEKLPNEQVLTQELNVSRTTVREAVKILITKNILEIERGKGTFVGSAPGIVDDPFGLDFVPDEILVPALCEARIILEPYVCMMAAERATKSQLKELEKIVCSMENASVSINQLDHKESLLDKMANLDIQFHSLLYLMSHNIIFERMIPIINKTVVVNYTSPVYRVGYQKAAAASTHRELLSALVAQDKDAAYNLCHNHMLAMAAELCSANE